MTDRQPIPRASHDQRLDRLFDFKVLDADWPGTDDLTDLEPIRTAIDASRRQEGNQ